MTTPLSLGRENKAIANMKLIYIKYILKSDAF